MHPMKLFSQSDCNTGRQTGVDAAKVLAIVFMVACHTMMYGGDVDLEHGLGMWFACILGGAPAAPVFMACMGIGVAYGRHTDAATLARRGLRMLVVSYIFNAVRAGANPLLGLFGGDTMHYHLFLYLFFFVDILQFAGVALLLLALLRRCRVGVAGTVGLSLAMSLAGSLVAENVGWLVQKIHTGILALDAPLALLVGTITPGGAPETPLVYSAFPLLNWFVFVALGLAIGKALRRCRDLDRLYALATPPAAILFIVFTIWGLKGGAPVHLYDSEEGYYYLTLVDALLVGLPAIVLMLGIGHFAGKALKGRAANLVLRISSDLNRIYLIHWIFVLWVVNALLYRTCGLKMSSLTLLVISFVILALSAVLARCRPFSRFKL